MSSKTAKKPVRLRGNFSRLKFALGALSFLFSAATLAATPEATKKANNNTGRWQCKASETGGWQCVGVEPPPASGVLYQAVKQDAAGRIRTKFTAVPSAHARLDWIDRPQLSEEQKQQTPAHCAGAYVEPEYVDPEVRNLDPATQPIQASSIKSETTEQGRSTLTGDVVMQQGYRQITGDKAIIDREAGTAEMIGKGQFREPGVLLIGHNAKANLDTKEVTVHDAEFVSHPTHMRGTAKQIDRDKQGRIIVEGGEITSCQPGVNSWTLAGKNLVLNRETGVGTAKHARLKVKGVPVFYTPYLRFPIDDRRKSGFLFPQLGSSDDGIDIATPYYLNIAPNYDATITPRYISDRGPGAELEFRYLHQNNEGILGGAYLASDDEFNDEDRWLGLVEHKGTLFRRINTLVDYSTVSDEDYFSDLGTSLSASSQTHLRRLGQASASGKYWNLYTRLLGYQTLDEAIADVNKPYDQLPDIRFNINYPAALGLDFGLKLNYAYFDRDNDNLTGLTKAVGHRLRTEPSISINLEWPYAFIRPTIKYKQVDYSLDDLDATLDDSPDISAPVYSLDTGLFFERETSFLGTPLTQTFEPRLFYLKVPEDDDQLEAPDFDTNPLTFSYNQLFRDDRFIGGDRIGDADQLSVGLTTRFLEDSGFERFRASIGQIYYFEDRRVTLTGLPTAADMESESSYAAEMLFALRSGWRIIGDIEWNPDTERTNESSVNLRYRRDNDHIFNLGYRIRNDRQKLEQSDISLIWPLGNHWRIITRWNQDLINDRIIEGLAGLEFQSCCWSVRIAARRWINDDDIFLIDEVEEKEGIYIQFQLKGLAGIGNSLESILSDSIAGYREQETDDLFRK